jgi:hypothetical protein
VSGPASGPRLSTTLRAALSTGPLRRCQAAAAVWRLVDLTNLVAVSVYLFGREGASAVAAFGVVRTVVPAIGLPVVAATAARTSAGAALTACASLAAAGSTGTAILLDQDGPVPAILAASAAVTLGLYGFRPLVTALYPRLVRSSDELVAANATSGFLDGVSSIIGPALGALALASSGPGLVLHLSAALLLTTALLVWPLRPIVVSVVAEADSRSRALDGFRALARPPVRPIVAMTASQTAVRGALNVIVVVFAVEVLATGDSGPGLLLSAIGVGAMVGFPLAVRLAPAHRLGRTLALALALWGGPLALAAGAPGPLVAGLLFAVVGLGNDLVDISTFSLLQRLVPERTLTRMLGAFETTLYVGMAIGAFAAGRLLDLGGARLALAVTGAVLPVVALVSLPRLRAIDQALADRDADVSLLQMQALFSPLSISVVDRLATCVETVDHAEGAVIVAQGEAGDSYLIIEHGTVAIRDRDRDVARLGPGDGLGEVALLRQVPRSASAIAVTDVRVRSLRAADFLAGIGSDPVARAAAEELIVARLAELGGRGTSSGC